MTKKRKFYLTILILLTIFTVWIIVSYKFEGQHNITVCPSKLIYNLPCPACGTTRAIILLIKGNIIESIKINPNVILICICTITSLYLYATDIIFKKQILYNLYNYTLQKLKGKIFYLLIFFELTIWIKNIITGI